MTFHEWGLDLPGTLQDAGGVGGLFSQTVIRPTANISYFPLADANGNAVTYSDDAGNVQAHYTYDAFGNTVSQSGTMAADFPFRFSSKYLDDETGLYFYGYRYYSSALGRWMSRDPYGKNGGINEYCSVNNSIINRIDFLGLLKIDPVCAEAKQVLNIKEAGGVICKDGKKHACVFVDPNNSDEFWYKNSVARNAVFYCSQRHEDEHLNHTKPCSECPEITKAEFWEEGEYGKRAECAAINAQISCLVKALQYCNGDKDCLLEIAREIGGRYTYSERMDCYDKPEFKWPLNDACDLLLKGTELEYEDIKDWIWCEKYEIK